jgi:hypothetical protein
MRIRVLASVVAMLAVAGVLAGCETGSTLRRTDAPQVLTGAQLPGLLGVPPSSVVAFAHVRVDGKPEWRQIPVQIDERKVVGFGSMPADNTTAGTTGTVYGSGSATRTALQYADPNTFVGADSDPSFDLDDELVFMVADAGGVRDAGSPDPVGVVPGSGSRVDLTDPIDAGKQGSVYLFRSSGGLTPAAGRDYVDYDFVLTSGDYKSTYRRRSGPNPETSRVTTRAYTIEYPDRWFETSWRLNAATSTGVDILDGHKNQFQIDTCARSNATFAAEEGAFVANIDGPVRGIRSYVGANSGPLTQRTHLMYRDQEVVVTDLRVHEISGIMDYLDFSAAAAGMTYQSSTVPGGVTIDGAADPVPATPATWEAVSGPQGFVLTKVEYVSSIDLTDGLGTELVWFRRDQAAPPEAQCWGDGSLLGAAGPSVVGIIANTDPRLGAAETLKGVRTLWFGGAPTDPSLVDEIGAAWSAQIAAPLVVTVRAA